MENTSISNQAPEVASEKLEPKDIFLHLLALVTLYASGVSLIILLFQYVNVWMPDTLSTAYGYGYDSVTGAKEMMRWALSCLVVLFPVYVFTTRYLNRIYERTQNVKTLRMHKWLVYFTLFITALTIIGDLVAVVYAFLQGDLTGRFMLKVLSILLVAGSLFWYYLMDVKRGNTPLAPQIKMIAWSIVGVITVAIIGGFVVAGSPASQRDVRTDEVRISHLSQIQDAIVTYWQAKNVLPQDLSALNDTLRGVAIPTDPETGLAYDYAMTGAESFELCAVFSTDSDASKGGSGYVSVPALYGVSGGNWNHPEGDHCFERTIDRDFFQSQLKPEPFMQ